MTKKEELIEELKRINFYWCVLNRGKSEAELEHLVQELKTSRQIIRGIFNHEIMGELDTEAK